MADKPKINRTMNLDQYHDYQLGSQVTYYKVVTCVNTTVHQIGDQLTKEQVDALINGGMKVTIK